MYAVEFDTQVSDGKIEVPVQYHDEFNSYVKVILFKPDSIGIAKKEEARAAKGFGALAHRANPALWGREEGAWERVSIFEQTKTAAANTKQK